VIVLRLRIDGQTQDHVFEQRHVVLGSARGAALRHTRAGWPARAGTLERRGAQVVLVVPGRVGTIPLTNGQPIMLGRAELTLLAEKPSPPAEFGDYDLPSDREASSAAYALARPASPTAPASLSAAGLTLAESPNAAPPTADSTPAPAVARQARPTTRDLFARRLNFDAELYQQLKRTPWFLASIALHVFLFLAFWLVSSPAEHTLPGGGGRVASAVMSEELREARGPEEQLDEPTTEAEPVVPETAEDSPLLEREPAPIEAPEIELGPMLLEEEPPTDLGTAPTLSDVGRRTAPKPARPRPAPGIDLERTIAKDNVHDARRQAAEHVRAQLGTGRGGAGEALDSLTADDLVVVQGEYDHQERVLRELHIPYRSVAPTDPRLESGDVLRKARFLFWNCGMPPSERLLKRLVPVVRDFVNRGGHLFTSDWVIGHVLSQAFPDRITTHGSASAIPHTVIGIRPVAAHAAHPLLEGVFHSSVAGRWWLESRSLDIVLPKPEAVTVLIESPELKERYGASTAVAVTFEQGKGRVLHILGHYDQEEGNVAGTVAVQRLALNFVLLSLRETPLRSAR